jgi:hypothetical protein
MMGRKRIYRRDGNEIYKWYEWENKMAQYWSTIMPMEFASRLARMANEKRINEVSRFNHEWNRVVKSLLANGVKIPPYQRRLYRAFFNELLKNRDRAGPGFIREYIIKKWSNPEFCGLKRDILEAIADIVWPQLKPKDTAKA